jgi:hypothetical protein
LLYTRETSYGTGEGEDIKIPSTVADIEWIIWTTLVTAVVTYVCARA